MSLVSKEPKLERVIEQCPGADLSEVPVGGAGPEVKVPAEVGRSRDGNCDAMEKL